MSVGYMEKNYTIFYQGLEQPWTLVGRGVVGPGNNPQQTPRDSMTDGCISLNFSTPLFNGMFSQISS